MSADELRASRARIAASGRDERRRIERALHDGPQQDLIALSVRLQLLRELVADGQEAALELVDELQRETHEALDRVRALAGEVYPSLLDARGLPDALRAAGAQVHAETGNRYPVDIESCVYFCCRAVIDAAHGTVTIRLRELEAVLRVELDCAGAADTTAARDLIESCGGTFAVEQPREGGTRVVAVAPLERR